MVLFSPNLDTPVSSEMLILFKVQHTLLSLTLSLSLSLSSLSLPSLSLQCWYYSRCSAAVAWIFVWTLVDIWMSSWKLFASNSCWWRASAVSFTPLFSGSCSLIPNKQHLGVKGKDVLWIVLAIKSCSKFGRSVPRLAAPRCNTSRNLAA